jgi:dihydropteroate synthase
MVLERPVVMGIINITPDSFYSGSRTTTTDEVLHLAERMLKEGATFVDVGAQSSRPGSRMLNEEEELNRLIEPLQALHIKFPEAFISVDTFYGKVAREAVQSGACLINDISGGEWDKTLIPAVKELNVPYVLMHRKGMPLTMQSEAEYENVTREVLDYLIWRHAVLVAAGINDIIIDPGFGFAKTLEHNFRLLKDLSLFNILERPVMLGISRKSTVYNTLGVVSEEALNGTTVLHTIGLLNGANILRCHDVKEAMEAIQLVQAYEGKK